MTTCYRKEKKKCTRLILFCRIEAARCPDVVVAQIDPKKLKKKQTVNISVSLRAFTCFVWREKKNKGKDVSIIIVLILESGWQNPALLDFKSIYRIKLNVWV